MILESALRQPSVRLVNSQSFFASREVADYDSMVLQYPGKAVYSKLRRKKGKKSNFLMSIFVVSVVYLF